MNQAIDARLLQSEFFEEHLTFVVAFELGNLRLYLCRNDQHLSLLVLHSFAYPLDVGIAILCRCLIYIADIKDRLARQEEKVMIGTLLIRILRLHRAGRLALRQRIFDAHHQVVLHLGILVRAYLGKFGNLGQTCLDGLQILELKFRVDDFLVADRIDRAIHMHHIVVVKATKHVDDGIRLADIGEELVAKAFALRGPFDKTGNIYYLDRCRDDAPGMDKFGKFIQSLIGHSDDAHLRIDGTKREISCLSLCARQTVEKSGFAHVRQSDDTTL